MGAISELVVKTVGVIVIGIVLIFGLGLLTAFPVMWLWNWLMPSLFGLTTLTYWKAWGLMVLCGLLFKSYSTSSSK